MAIRFALGGTATPNALFAVAGPAGDGWQVESIGRITADGAHAVAWFDRLGPHAFVSLPSCASPAGTGGGGLVGDPMRRPPNSPVIPSHNGGTWVWLSSEGPTAHVGSRDYMLEENSTQGEAVDLSGDGDAMAYAEGAGIRMFRGLSGLTPTNDFLTPTDISVPDGSVGEVLEIKLSYDGDRMLFVGRQYDSPRMDAYLWVRGAGVRSVTSPDGRDGSLALNGSVREVALSGDGRWMTFVTDATNVVPGHEDWGGVYLRDLETGATTLVARWGSVRSAGAAISHSGRFVAWLDPPYDAAETGSLWVLDRRTQTRTEVNLDADGTRWRVDTWSMSSRGTRFVFGAVDYAAQRATARTRWLRAASSDALYDRGVSPVFHEITGSHPVITGDGGSVFSGEYGSEFASPFLRAVWRDATPQSPIPGAASAPAEDRFEYETARVTWPDGSAWATRTAFVLDGSEPYATAVPLTDAAGEATLSPRLPLGGHTVVTVQRWDDGDGVGACVASAPMQVGRVRPRGIFVDELPFVRSRSMSFGARYLDEEGLSVSQVDPDGTFALERYDRRDEVVLRDRVEGLVMSDWQQMTDREMSMTRRRGVLRVNDTASDPARLSTYHFDLGTHSVTAAYHVEYQHNPSFPLGPYHAALSAGGRVALFANISSFGHALSFGTYETPSSSVLILNRDFYAQPGRSLLYTGVSLVEDGRQVIFQEEIDREVETTPGWNPTHYYRYELRRWNREVGSETLLLSFAEQRLGNTCESRRAQLAELVTSNDGRWVTFCGPTPEGITGVPEVACRGAAGARWLYDVTEARLVQLSPTCTPAQSSAPVFTHDGRRLVYFDPTPSGRFDVAVRTLATGERSARFTELTRVGNLCVNGGGTHLTFSTDDPTLAAALAIQYPTGGTSTFRDFTVLAPLQDEYLGPAITEPR